MKNQREESVTITQDQSKRIIRILLCLIYNIFHLQGNLTKISHQLFHDKVLSLSGSGFILEYKTTSANQTDDYQKDKRTKEKHWDIKWILTRSALKRITNRTTNCQNPSTEKSQILTIWRSDRSSMHYLNTLRPFHNNRLCHINQSLPNQTTDDRQKQEFLVRSWQSDHWERAVLTKIKFRRHLKKHKRRSRYMINWLCNYKSITYILCLFLWKLRGTESNKNGIQNWKCLQSLLNTLKLNSTTKQ